MWAQVIWTYELYRKILNITKDVQVFQFVVFMWLNGCIGFAFFCGLQASGSAFAADFARAREELEERRLCERIMNQWPCWESCLKVLEAFVLDKSTWSLWWYHGHMKSQYMSVPWFPHISSSPRSTVHHSTPQMLPDSKSSPLHIRRCSSFVISWPRSGWSSGRAKARCSDLLLCGSSQIWVPLEDPTKSQEKQSVQFSISGQPTFVSWSHENEQSS